jgi:hypothetical protein
VIAIVTCEGVPPDAHRTPVRATGFEIALGLGEMVGDNRLGRACGLSLIGEACSRDRVVAAPTRLRGAS